MIAEKNVQKVMHSDLEGLDQQEFEILTKYVKEGRTNPLVKPTYVLTQLDAIEVIRNLKAMEEHYEAYSPDVVQLERLKAKYLLQEPGAEAELREFLVNKPYMRKQAHWADLEEASFWDKFS
eukprot:TRINITY_DN5361_c0_g2_i5.p1 TRINITY_DN5361_c0_g2~~TRINITY_DN5361_c0_g2_i5.p1  ORF type:complete len:122 (-),score=41.16 TRINITY_DN5361_c0_g2_i5:137-502(-)